jgi:heme-degrading monooxygenase HmoA
MSDRVQHVVLFKFPQALSSEEEKEMFERVRSWTQHITGLTGLRFGKDETGRSGGFDYLLITQFDNEEDHQSYYPQEAHVAFSKWVKDRNCEVIRVDYRLTPETLLI